MQVGRESKEDGGGWKRRRREGDADLLGTGAATLTHFEPI
jgi:hypothetical protein